MRTRNLKKLIFLVENYIMASGSENKIGDFDIDEVINWDDHTYASKGLEFGELPLGLEEHVAGTSQQVSQETPSVHQDDLLLGNSMLPTRSPVVKAREPRTSMVSQPQRISTSLFSNSTNAIIQAGLLQAARSGSLATPAFPSENFDLPPITPPASAAPPSIFTPLDHQIVTGGPQRIPSSHIVSRKINTSSNIQANMSSFSQPNLTQPLTSMGVDQHLGPPVDEVMEEGSIDKIIDEIVDRDMPQGVSSPIVFTHDQQVNQNLNTTNLTSGNLQQVSAPVQQNMAPARSSSPGQRPQHLEMSQHISQTTSIAGTPLNVNPLNQNPGSPHQPNRTPSPQIAAGQSAQKISLASPVGQRQAVSVQGIGLALSQPSLSQTRSVKTQNISSEKLNAPHPMSPLPVQSIGGIQQVMTRDSKSAGQGNPRSAVSQQSSVMARSLNTNVPIQKQQQTKMANANTSQSQTQPITPKNTSFPTSINQGVFSSGAQASKPLTTTSGEASKHLGTPTVGSTTVAAKAATFANVKPGVSTGSVPNPKGKTKIQAIQLQGKLPPSGVLTQAQAMHIVKAVAPNVTGQVMVSQATTSTGNKVLLYVLPQSSTNTQVQYSASSTSGQKVKMIVISTTAPHSNLQQQTTVVNTNSGQTNKLQTIMSTGQVRNVNSQQRSVGSSTAQAVPANTQLSAAPVKSSVSMRQQFDPLIATAHSNQNNVSGQNLSILDATGPKLSTAVTQIANMSDLRQSSMGISNNNKTSLPVSMIPNAQLGKQPVTSLVANGTCMSNLPSNSSMPQEIVQSPALAYSQSAGSANQSSSVQITFVNETTAISTVKVVSSSPTSSSWLMPNASQLFSSLNTTTSTQALPTPIVTASATSVLSPAGGISDDEDSTPLALLRKIASEEPDDLMPLAHLKKNSIAEPVPTSPLTDLKTKPEEKKKKKKGKKKKRDGEPAKPASAYQIFFKETQTALSNQNTSVPFADIAKMLTQRWENLPEEQKKIYHTKHEEAMVEYRKALEQFKGKQKLVDMGEPSAKQRKLSISDAVALGSSPNSVTLPGSVSNLKENPASVNPVTLVTNSTKLSKNMQSTKVLPTTKNITTTASGKPVATVSPMATVKKSNTESGTFTKPKKSKVTINPISQRLCIRDGCTMPARTTKERGTQYCSHECIVKHCRVIFNQWVSARRAEAR